MEVKGVVRKGPFAHGSKSERDAIYLEAASGERFVLRRPGGNPFFDPQLEQYVGRHVVCHGSITGYTLLADAIEPVT